jgi:hypothetical protein
MDDYTKFLSLEMDFTKLSTEELNNFLQLNGLSIPYKRSDSIRKATKLIKRANIQYTIPVLNLYWASRIIGNKKYSLHNLNTFSLRKLNQLFVLFNLEPTEENRTRLIDILRLARAIDYDLSFLESLPSELIYIILHQLTDRQLSSICSASSKMYSFCSYEEEAEEFWHNRYIMQEGDPSKFFGSWKLTYKSVFPHRRISVRNSWTDEFYWMDFYASETIFQILDYLGQYFTRFENMIISFIDIMKKSRYINKKSKMILIGGKWLPISPKEKLLDFSYISNITLN